MKAFCNQGVLRNISNFPNVFEQSLLYCRYVLKCHCLTKVLFHFQYFQSFLLSAYVCKHCHNARGLLYKFLPFIFTLLLQVVTAGFELTTFVIMSHAHNHMTATTAPLFVSLFPSIVNISIISFVLQFLCKTSVLQRR